MEIKISYKTFIDRAQPYFRLPNLTKCTEIFATRSLVYFSKTLFTTCVQCRCCDWHPTRGLANETFIRRKWYVRESTFVIAAGVSCSPSRTLHLASLVFKFLHRVQEQECQPQPHRCTSHTQGCTS